MNRPPTRLPGPSFHRGDRDLSLLCVLICVKAGLPCSRVCAPRPAAGAVRQREPQWNQTAFQTRILRALLAASASTTITGHPPPNHREGFREPPGTSQETTGLGENPGLPFLLQSSALDRTGSGAFRRGATQVLSIQPRPAQGSRDTKLGHQKHAQQMEQTQG